MTNNEKHRSTKTISCHVLLVHIKKLVDSSPSSSWQIITQSYSHKIIFISLLKFIFNSFKPLVNLSKGSCDKHPNHFSWNYLSMIVSFQNIISMITLNSSIPSFHYNQFLIQSYAQSCCPIELHIELVFLVR